MPTLSIYTFVKDGLFYDFHVEAMLRHHLPLADEIVVNEGFSKDGTYELICDIDPKVRVFRSSWGPPHDFDWFVKFKEDARKRCVGDWCLHLDCDEFIPEWEFDGIRRYIESADNMIASMKMLNFYGSFRVIHRAPYEVGFPVAKSILFRNVPEAEVWGDGSNVRIRGLPDERPTSFHCHHFGFVRDPARLRQKWRNVQGPIHDGRSHLPRLPSFVFDLKPHDWLDPKFLAGLAAYDGPFVKAVRDDPEEFERDGGVLSGWISQDPSHP